MTPGPLLPSPCECPQLSNEGFGENDLEVFPFSVLRDKVQSTAIKTVVRNTEREKDHGPWRGESFRKWNGRVGYSGWRGAEQIQLEVLTLWPPPTRHGLPLCFQMRAKITQEFSFFLFSAFAF